MNVSITGFEGANGGSYVPSFGEIAVTLMLVAMGFGLFSLAVKHLNVFPEEEPEGVPQPIPVSRNGRTGATRPAPILRP